MKENLRDSNKGINNLVSRLAAEKKKTVFALCLIAIMAFMWIRVLGKKMPQAAEAAMRGGQVTGGESNSELKISFIELPEVKGRNDVLTRDFFTVSDWEEFIRDGEGKNSGDNEEVNVVSRDGSEEIARRVAKELKLEAIVLGESSQAFINDKLLSVGDKLPIREGSSTYECEVTGIEENMVFIRCGEAEITLKLTSD